MQERVTYTASEAAFLLGLPLKALKKMMDEGQVEATLVGKPGARPVRQIAWRDVIYLWALRTLRDELTPKARKEFYRALKNVPVDRTGEVRFGRLSVLIDDLKTEVETRARALVELAESVEFRNDGEALLKGTKIEAHRIAALLAGGMTPGEIGEDYPSLNLEQILTAKAYAEAYPKTGRPYPAKTVKRALKGAGLEALDEVLDDKQ